MRFIIHKGRLYTIIAQTAAEMMGVDLADVTVRLGDSDFPVHADIPHQEVIFLEEADEKSSPMKAKGVGELGITGIGAAVANAVCNATGVRVRDYPITLDKLIDHLPDVA